MEGLAIVVVKGVVTAFALLSAFAGLMVMERKFLGWFQMRLGPNRTGPWGLLQPMADGLKLIFKEDIIPAEADRIIYRLAPVLSVLTALAAFAVIPIGPPVELFGRQVSLSVVDPPAGILVLLAFTGLSVYGIALGGWASQSKYALLGAVRSTAQMVSYELSMSLSLLGVLLLAGSLRLPDIVAAQSPLPFLVLQPVGFAVFLVCIVAETNRAPFDLPEAETELVAGYHTEYTGLRFGMFGMAEYVNMITFSCLTVLLYLGGWNGPAFLPPVAWFVLKTAPLLFFFFWLRATLPRIRYDRLMAFGWKVLLPLAVLNLLATALVVALG